MPFAPASNSCRCKRKLFMTGKKIAQWFEYVLLATGIGLLVYVAVSYVFAAVYQFYLQRIFLADPPPALRTRVASPSREGSLTRRLEIQRLNVSVMMLEGPEDRILRATAGQVPGRDLSGFTGTLANAAHRHTFFGPYEKPKIGLMAYAVGWTQIVKPADIPTAGTKPMSLR
jgi:hypothetical protein